MLLSISFEEISEWVSLFANIATFITALTAIGALVSVIFYFKNRPTNKTFQVSFQIRRIDEFKEDNTEMLRLISSLEICNFTDKEFSIIECNLIYCNCHYIMQERYKIFPNGQLYGLKPLKNISIDAHQSLTMPNVIFEIPNLINKKAILEVKTTQKTLIYKVNLEAQNS